MQNLLTDSRLYMKLGTCRTFSKTKSGRIEILPVRVTITLKDLGRFICKGASSEVKDIKVFESKHMCSNASESMIQVLELKTENKN